MKIRHILLTTDLSDAALRPFEPVLELARSSGARVTVLHVVRDLPIAAHGAPLAPPIHPPNLQADLKTARASLEDQCRALGDGVEVVAAVISHQNPASGIVEFAEEHDVDLVALSSHGRTGFRRFALGSVAEAVLRHSAVPVLSFHRPTETLGGSVRRSSRGI